MAYLDLRPLTRDRKAYFGNAELVDTIKANTIPARELVIKYYSGGPRIPESVFTASRSNRLIYKKPDGSYIVLPDTPRNMACIRQTH